MKRKIHIFLLLKLILGISLNIAAQERFVNPVDDGAKDSSFKIYRENLINAVKKKNKTSLINALDKNIKVSFGGDDGIADFKEFWKLDEPNSTLWNELLTVLTNGGKFITEGKSKTFCAPYSFSAFPEDLDPFENNLIFGNNVRLRSQPDLSAEILDKLSYNVVQIDFENSVKDAKNDENYAWLKIKTLGGKEGFVSAEFVRSPVDYRAFFNKVGGKWKMTAFVSGD